MTSKKDLGQYFTENDTLQQFVFNLVKNKGSRLLEPSFGAGHLLTKFLSYDSLYPMVCYELDRSIRPIIKFGDGQSVLYGDFTKQKIDTKFKTIIGNPPYVKQKDGNLYLKFIDICFSLLDIGGELIFIVPSDFIKITSAAALITKMCMNGTFTDFLFPNDERLFSSASVDIMVFRYEKGLITKNCAVNSVNKIYNVTNGIITFSDTEIVGQPLSELFNVYVGLVSGKEEVFRMPFGNIDVINDSDSIDKYVFIDKYPSGNSVIDKHLLLHKPLLMARQIRKFTEKNWFEWGAIRNIPAINSKLGSPCIYIKSLSRKQNVAFVGKVQYFSGGLLCLIPKNTISLEKVVTFLNSLAFQKDYTYAGRFKIGQKQLSNALLPLVI